MKRFPWISFRRPAVYGLRVTSGGVGFILGTILIGLAAIDADINLLMMIFGLCSGGLLINALHGWRTLRFLTIRRVVPEVAVAGQPFLIRYSITNRRRFGVARNLVIDERLDRRSTMPAPSAYVPALRPGETVTVSVSAMSPNRGRLGLSEIRLSTRFPFCLFTKWTLHRHQSEVVVFPRLGRLLSDISAPSRSSETSGSFSGIGHRKGEDEYYGIREYREGDNPRRIHWRRSASTGQLMIREMAQTRSRQLWCVVDTRIEPNDAAMAERLELAISAAATVICDALDHGSKVGLICNGVPLVVLPPGSGRAYSPRLLRELALRTANHDDDLASHIRRLNWPARWHGHCLLFGAEAGEATREAAQALSRTFGHATLLAPDTPAFEKMFEPSIDPSADNGSSGGDARLIAGSVELN